MHPASIAIVGGSLAGVTTAERLRANGFLGTLTLVGDEHDLPYDRPPLSKAALQSPDHPVAEPLRTAAELAALGLDLRLGVSARRLVPGAHTHLVELADGSEVVAERVVVATGARARTLPFAEPQDGVFVLRTAADAAALRAALGTGTSIVIVGGGFLGLEVAASARRRGVATTVLEAAATPLSGRLGAAVGEWVVGLHRRHGVDLRCGSSVAGFVGHTDLEGVALSDGSLIDADAALVSVGSLPNVEWLAGSGVEIDDGVVCDAWGRTSVPGVFAAGDVTRYAVAGEPPVRTEHWSGAVAHARLVAENMLLPECAMRTLAAVPYFWSDQFGQKLQVVGEWAPGLEERLIEGNVADGRFGVVFEERGEVRAAAGVDMPGFVAAQRRTIQEARVNQEKEEVRS